jgi:hypothetical protein
MKILNFAVLSVAEKWKIIKYHQTGWGKQQTRQQSTARSVEVHTRKFERKSDFSFEFSTHLWRFPSFSGTSCYFPQPILGKVGGKVGVDLKNGTISFRIEIRVQTLTSFL